MTRIGIIGASSQSGSSVAFFLKKFPGLRVTCFIRSDYSRIFFDLLDLECDNLDINDTEGLRQKIGMMDAILDFGYPAGQLHEILDRSTTNIGHVLSVMKKGSIYIYMSSIMAYGMPDDEKWISHYRFPRTSYAYIKRVTEKFISSRSRQHGILAYNLRLGQVHGFLQSVNGSFRKRLSETNIARIDGSPDDPVNIIFIHSLCEAIVACIKGVHPPGLYTIVSDPQWTLKTLYEYYLRCYDLSAVLVFDPAAATPAKKSLLQKSIDLARPWRSLLETYILMRFPRLTTKIKGRFRQSELLSQKSAVLKELPYIDFNLLGRPPFQTIPGLTTDPEKIMQIEKEQETYYYSKIATASR
jgi:nucleoside-diphosphate-sugar epimerase